MLEFKEKEDKIKKLTVLYSTKKNKVLNFFKNGFNQFNLEDKKRILELFEKKKISNWYLFLEKNEDIRKIILNESKEYLQDFLKDQDTEKCKSLLKFVTVYLNINTSNLDQQLMKEIIEKISALNIKDNNIIKNSDVKDILSYYIKEIAWNCNEDNFLNNEYYAKIQNLVCEYINHISLDENLYEDKFLQLIIETQHSLKSKEVLKRIKEKFNVEPNLDKYLQVQYKQTKNPYNDLIIYRMQKGKIPKELCSYFINNSDTDRFLDRIVNVDYIKYYLEENNIENPNVFFDDLLKTPGVASFRRLALNNYKLNEQAFHEATHVIQQEDLLVRKNYEKIYRYSMLKDFILQKDVGWEVYSKNHSNWLFEIDADIQGEKQYYQYLKNINYTEMSNEEIDKIIEYTATKEQERLKSSKFIEIDGTKKDKKILFDEIIIKNPKLISKHPILALEYNLDGTKKEIAEILKALERKYEEDGNKLELQSVATCIFEDIKNIDKDSFEELSKYNTNNLFIMNIKEKLLSLKQMSLLQQKEIELSKLESEEKIISEAEKIIEQQKEGQDRGE